MRHSCTAKVLHSFWDDALGTVDDAQAAAHAAAKLHDPDAGLASVVDEKTWIDESFKAAKNSAYAPPIRVGSGPYTLTKGCKAKAVALAKVRVALAGARLANLLNEELR